LILTEAMKTIVDSLHERRKRIETLVERDMVWLSKKDRDWIFEIIDLEVEIIQSDTVSWQCKKLERAFHYGFKDDYLLQKAIKWSTMKSIWSKELQGKLKKFLVALKDGKIDEAKVALRKFYKIYKHELYLDAENWLHDFNIKLRVKKSEKEAIWDNLFSLMEHLHSLE